MLGAFLLEQHPLFFPRELQWKSDLISYFLISSVAEGLIRLIRFLECHMKGVNLLGRLYCNQFGTVVNQFPDEAFDWYRDRSHLFHLASANRKKSDRVIP